MKAKKAPSQKRLRVKWKIVDSSSGSSDEDILSLASTESTEHNSDLEQSDSVKETSKIQEGDFALVRVLGKRKEHFYVAEVLTKKHNDLHVKYLKRIKNNLGINKFVYNSDTVYEMTTDDVLKKLPAPISVGATARQSRFLLFDVMGLFDDYDVE